MQLHETANKLAELVAGLKQSEWRMVVQAIDDAYKSAEKNLEIQNTAYLRSQIRNAIVPFSDFRL